MDVSPYDAAAAAKTIAGLTRRTPVLAVDVPGGGEVLLKLENLQVTGSFKVRGAANRMLTMGEDARARGVIACSSGNHGRAVSYIAERLGIPATICVPDWVDPTKLEAIRGHGAEAILSGDTYDAAEARAEELGRERALAWVHPFDDPAVIAGQGTITLELLEDRTDVRQILVPLSGGGLAAGIAAAAHADPTIEVVAVSARNARVMFESVRVGRPIPLAEEPTVATALSGGIGLENMHSFQLVRELVHRHVLVGEDEITQAMGWAARDLHMVVEGGGATALAAVLAGHVEPTEGTAIIISGGNIGLAELDRLIGSVRK